MAGGEKKLTSIVVSTKHYLEIRDEEKVVYSIYGGRLPWGALETIYVVLCGIE